VKYNFNKESHLKSKKAGEREKLIGIQMNEEVEWLPILNLKFITTVCCNFTILTLFFYYCLF